MDSKVALESVGKEYRVYAKPFDRLLDAVVPGSTTRYHRVQALDDITINIAPGERIGILGENGSGKSTLLKIMSNVLSPSVGSVDINGRVSALLELGSGFNGEFTGRQNIEQNGLVHGFAVERTRSLLPEIVEFSELGDFIENPVKTYSSGMVLRLAFACAVHIDPDILIIDEALSVGDAYFQNKCLHKIASLLDKGVTFLYVSHSSDSVKSLCERAIWLQHGKIHEDGQASAVGQKYEKFLWEKVNRASWSGPEESTLDHSNEAQPAREKSALFKPSKAFERAVEPLRVGDGRVRVENIEVIHDGAVTESVPFAKGFCVRVHIKVVNPPPARTAACVGISNKNAVELFHMCSLDHGLDLSSATAGQEMVLDFELTNPFCPGEYLIAVGLNTMRPSPENDAILFVDAVFDHCVGGSRFKVPVSSATSSAWGNFSVPYSIRDAGGDA